MNKKLKLYVWEKVLLQWDYGIAFAIAESEEQAKKLIYDKYKNDFEELDEQTFLDFEEPKIYTTPVGYYLWGSA